MSERVTVSDILFLLLGLLFGVLVGIGPTSSSTSKIIIKRVRVVERLQAKGVQVTLTDTGEVWLWEERSKTSFDVTRRIDTGELR